MIALVGSIRDYSGLSRDYSGLFVIIQDYFVTLRDYLGIIRDYSGLFGGGPDEFSLPQSYMETSIRKIYASFSQWSLVIYPAALTQSSLASLGRLSSSPQWCLVVPSGP